MGAGRPRGAIRKGTMTQAASVTQIQRRVVLQANGTGSPLFVFPGIHGTPETFAELAERLGAERPVYGFRLVGMQQECEPVRQVGRLAQLYAAEVRSVQARGPYHLFGYSLGGAIAFEVARELRSQSERVGLVVMADCPAPGYPAPSPALKRARTHLDNLLGASPRQRLQYLRDRALNAGARIGRVIGLTPGADEIMGADDPEYVQRVDAALYEAYVHYVPSPLCVDVLFMTADTPPDWPTVVFDDPLMGWGPALRGRITQCNIPGAHLSIFAPQNLPALALQLREALARAERLDQTRQRPLTLQAAVPGANTGPGGLAVSVGEAS
jgi:thioesterase domain-containing protein